MFEYFFQWTLNDIYDSRGMGFLTLTSFSGKPGQFGVASWSSMYRFRSLSKYSKTMYNFYKKKNRELFYLNQFKET